MAASVFDVIPQDYETEQLIIGSLIFGGAERLRAAASLIQPRDFYQSQLGCAFAVLVDMGARGVEPDPHSLNREVGLWNQRYPREQINHALLLECQQYALANGKLVNFDTYCGVLRELSRRRDIQDLLLQTATQLADPGSYADPILQELRRGVDEIGANGCIGTSTESARQIADEEHQRLVELYDSGRSTSIEGVTTGVGWIDEQSGGYQAGDLIVKAARPNTSKTRWTIYSLGSAAASGVNVGFISLDMGRARLTKYLLPQLANLGGQQAYVKDLYEPGGWGEMEKLRLRDICQAVDREERCWMVRSPKGKRLTNIESYVRELANKRGCKVIALDQLQNIDGWEDGNKDRSNYARTVKFLKDLAGYYGIALIALHQIQRAGADAPTLANLKDTGCLEEYADAVFILHDRQRAMIEAYGGFVREDGRIRKANSKDEPGDIIRNVEPVRPLRVDLAKNRNESTRREYVSFNFAKGVREIGVHDFDQGEF